MKKILRGEKTRTQILEYAANIASVEGLFGLTIGKLASETNISKSGLYSHFGSKEELQLAVVEKAREIFRANILEPNEEQEAGLTKLIAFLDSWLGYIRESVFTGGCFFSAVALEVDDRPGRLKDLVAEVVTNWQMIIEKEIKLAIRLGELKSASDSQLLTFQFHAFVRHANSSFRLQSDVTALGKARESALAMFGYNASKTGKALLASLAGK